MITETAIDNASPIAEKIAAQNEIIFKLRQQIKEQTEKKKALEKQQKAIDKLVRAAASLELAEDAETINYLWESLAAVLPPLFQSEVEEKNEITPNPTAEVESNPIPETEANEVDEIEINPNAIDPEQETEKLIKNPVKKNSSNEFFAWQPTSNDAIATYFNLKSGRTQAAYFGANNKQRFAEIETKLMRWFPGISCSKRMAQRLTEYKYELKVIGWERVPNFDDSDFLVVRHLQSTIYRVKNERNLI